MWWDRWWNNLTNTLIMYQKQKWTYGVYEWNWIREWPTQKKFEGWKKDFLSLSEV